MGSFGLSAPLSTNPDQPGNRAHINPWLSALCPSLPWLGQCWKGMPVRKHDGNVSGARREKAGSRLTQSPSAELQCSLHPQDPWISVLRIGQPALTVISHSFCTLRRWSVGVAI